MSVEQARALVERALADPAFAERLASAPMEQRREILTDAGYGDVRLRHLSEVLPASAGGELTDEEFLAVSGGGKGDTVELVTLSVAGSAAVGSASVAIAALAL